MWLPNSRERSFAQAAEFPREIVRAYRELPGETFPIPGRDPFQLVLAFLVFHSLEYMLTIAISNRLLAGLYF